MLHVLNTMTEKNDKNGELKNPQKPKLADQIYSQYNDEFISIPKTKIITIIYRN